MAIRHHRRRRQMSEINVVPYIDVMLVLLVIFMVTAPLLIEGVKVDLPEVDAGQLEDESKNDEPFVVIVDRDGNYYLNENINPVELNEIRVKAKAVLRNNPDTPFWVKGDRSARYDAVLQAMDMLKKAKVPSVGMIAD